MFRTNPAQNRNDGIDTLRGLACILLLALHVIGESTTSGLRLPDDHPLAMFTAVFFHMRMPMFAMLSGFVYAYRPAQPGQSGAFLTGKLRRILLPFLFVTTAYGFVNSILKAGYGVPWSEFWTLYVQAYAHLWFLQAIFFLFLIIGLLDTLFSRWPVQTATGFLVVSAALFLSGIGRGIEWMSIDRTLYLAPFFALGVFLNRYEVRMTRSLLIAFASTVAVLGALHLYSIVSDPSAVIARRTPIALALGLTISGTLILLRDRLRFAPLAAMGRYSYAIYLYHMFPVLALLAAYKIFGFPNPYLSLALGITLGLALPIIAQQIALRLGKVWPLLPIITLGLKPKSETVRRPAPRTGAQWRQALFG